ncbi:hypothetical protein ABIA96_006204 [Bradyrhizobium sp. LB11.1]
MTGAGRLPSGLQPVTANTAPLCLSCTVDRRRHCVSALAATSVRVGSPKGENPAQSGVSASADSPAPQGGGKPLGWISKKSVDQCIARWRNQMFLRAGEPRLLRGVLELALFRVVNRYVRNLAPMPRVSPDYKTPIVRNGQRAANSSRRGGECHRRQKR